MLRLLVMGIVAMALSACGGCASVATGVTAVGAADAALKAAGISRDVYCALPPETRVEFRTKNHIPHLIACPNDTPPPAPQATTAQSTVA